MTVGQQPEPSVFIQFAGQGVKYIDDLRRLYSQNPCVQPFIIDCIKEISIQAKKYDDSKTGFFHCGIDIETWINSPGETPDQGYLLSSPLSHPLIFLTQIANYLSLILDGLDQDKLIRNTHSATGFSTGVVAAILVSLNLPVDALIKKAIKTQAMFFWQGIRTQQSMFRKNIHPVIDSGKLSTAEGSKSCMASINNIMRKQLDETIRLFSGQGTIHPSYEIFPGRWIVAGSPDHLEAFSRFLKGKNEKCEWRYIPSTIAAHSPYLDYALETSPVDAERIGLSFDAVDMKIPVLSNNDGIDLRESNAIIKDVMEAYFIRTAIWKKQISPLMPPTSVKYVLDFGPGPGVASLTENFTTRSGIKVIRCSNPLGRKQLFDEMLPTLTA